MLILPTTATTDGQARAQKLLQAVVDQRVYCTLVVPGDGDRPREIASRADRRAENNPFRGVVLIPDPGVLAGNPQFKQLLDEHAAGAEAIALTIRFELSSTLAGDEALDFLALERAFAKAGAGEVAK